MDINKNSLFYKDNKLFEFNSKVINCLCYSDRFGVVLENTGFFPEAGGQYADKGTLNGIEVIDVRVTENGIEHFVKEEISKDTVVHGVLDKELRLKKERNHTAEHIVSGIVYKLFGYDNVGFHMGENSMDVDFNGNFTLEQLSMVEKLANRVVRDNVEVKTYFPSDEELKHISYRSKLELSSPRIVEIVGCDMCACCAPHVSSTGEIGLIKIVDSYKNRGNTRLTLLASDEAVEYVLSITEDASKSASMLSVKPYAVSNALDKKLKNFEELSRENGDLKRKLSGAVIETLKPTDNYLVVFTESFVAKDVINKGILMSKKGVCVFCQNGNEYTYMLASNTKDMKALSGKLNEQFNGKGGGKKESAMGRITAQRHQIEEFFENEEKE